MSELVDRARIIGPEIIAAHPEMERLRRLPDTLARTIADAQFYRLCVPREYGGLEADPRTVVETIETLAETDASVAWCVMIGAATGAFSAYLAPEIAAPIFADPALVLAGVYAPMGTATLEGDHYRVTGRWKWNSGGQNATWLCGGCVIMKNNAPHMQSKKTPDHRMMLFPASDASFIDTWHTTGLRGTGSGDMAVREILVPCVRSVSLIDDRPHIARPLYAFPIFGLLAIGIAAVASGNARSALAEFSALASSRRTPSGRTLADRGTVQAAFAEASARLSASRAFLLAEIDACWIAAQEAPALAVHQRARLRLAATYMTRTATEVTRIVHDLSGGSGVFLGEPLNRRLADAQTMTAHVMTAPATYELTGRALLGLPVFAGEL